MDAVMFIVVGLVAGVALENKLKVAAKVKKALKAVSKWRG